MKSERLELKLENINIDPDDLNFNLPPGAIGAEIVEYIDIRALASMNPPNTLYTFHLNVSRDLDGLAIINASALSNGITATATFSLLDTDNYATEAELTMAILLAITQLQTGSVAVVELNYFQLTCPPFDAILPAGPDAALQWELNDISALLRTLATRVKEYYELVAENGN
jgi:hypothetical protein